MSYDVIISYLIAMRTPTLTETQFGDFQLSESDYKLINDKCDETIRWLDANQVPILPKVTNTYLVTYICNYKYM
jgi:hypothetical protein